MPRMDKTNQKTTNFEKKYGLPKSCRKIKLTRKIKTINDLLAKSDINSVIEDLLKVKADITDLVIIYKADNSIHLLDQVSTPLTTELGMLEVAKNIMLNDFIEDEE